LLRKSIPFTSIREKFLKLEKKWVLLRFWPNGTMGMRFMGRFPKPIQTGQLSSTFVPDFPDNYRVISEIFLNLGRAGSKLGLSGTGRWARKGSGLSGKKVQRLCAKGFRGG
jgi:hypothetical protein